MTSKTANGMQKTTTTTTNKAGVNKTHIAANSTGQMNISVINSYPFFSQMILNESIRMNDVTAGTLPYIYYRIFR